MQHPTPYFTKSLFLNLKSFLVSAMLVALAAMADSQGGLLTPIGMTVPSVVSRSTLVGPISPSTILNINVSLKLPNPTALAAFNDGVSNPKSLTYRQFITPAQFGTKFGQPTAIVNQAVSYLKSEGLTIKLVAKNNLNIMASGTAKQVAAAFGTTINSYHAVNPKEPGRMNFYSFSSSVKLPASFAAEVLNVAGLEDFTMAHPRTTLSPQLVHTLYNTFPMYSTGYQGQGRVVAISNFDGFSLSNVPLYYNQFDLPTPAGGVGSNITVITIDGGSESHPPGDEGDLDIQMVLGQAPLCTLMDYDGGGPLIDVLTKEADDNLADILTESYGWDLSTSDAEAANVVHQQMTAQGQTYMFAAGDSGTTLEPYSYPNTEPETLCVGGSAAQVDANGNRVSEVAWGNGAESSTQGGGGGGWATDALPFNVLPSWQRATGCPTNINFRLNPDVAFQASGSQTGAGAFYYYTQGQFESVDLGTSFASPSFAGGLAVTEQWLIANGWTGNATGAQLNRFGRIADLLYSQNLDPSIWYDIVVGDTGPLPNGAEATAHAGWDFCSGLGAINFQAFANSQATTAVTIGTGTASIYSDQANGTLGTNPSGSNTNLTGSNGLAYNVTSVQSVYGPAVGLNIQFTLPSETFTSLTMTIGATAAQGTTLFLYALDANNQYDLISTSALTGTATTVKVSNLQPYVLNGKVNLVARAILPSRFNVNQFTLSLDQATLAGFAHK